MSVTEIYTKGYTVITSLISEKECDNLKNYLHKNFTTNLPYNYYKGHYQIKMPTNLNDIPQEILFNKKIHEVIANVFSKNYYMHSYTCNANIAQVNQPYHMDSSHFHTLNTIRKFGSPGPPVQLIANVYLQDTNEHNGSFDIAQ